MFRFCGFVKSSEEEPQEQLPRPDDDGPSHLPEDSSENNGRCDPAMVVFFSNIGMYTMRTCHELSIDGTFGTCPSPFRQIVFIQAKQEGKRAVPVVFALFSNKVLEFGMCHELVS